MAYIFAPEWYSGLCLLLQSTVEPTHQCCIEVAFQVVYLTTNWALQECCEMAGVVQNCTSIYREDTEVICECGSEHAGEHARAHCKNNPSNHEQVKVYDAGYLLVNGIQSYPKVNE